MALQHMIWANSLRKVSPEAKLIALYLADNADADDWGRAIIDKLADWANLKPRQIRTEIQWLNLEFVTDTEFTFLRAKIPTTGGNDGSWSISIADGDFFPEDCYVKQPNDWPAAFRDLWWKIYPRREDKKPAMRSLERIARGGKTRWAEIVEGTQHYADFMRGKETKFIKLPATFLNAESWKNRYNGNHERPKSFLEAAADLWSGDDGTGSYQNGH